VNVVTKPGQNVYVGAADLRGSATGIPAKALQLSAEHYPLWQLNTKLPPGKAIAYKVIYRRWCRGRDLESIPNRALKTPAHGSSRSPAAWDKP